MAIAYDATAGANTGAPATSYTYAHTCTGSDRILFVGAMIAIGTDTITGVTYNGTATTLIASQKMSTASGYYAKLYYLVAPSTGANNVVISSSSSGFIFGKSASYTGASQTGQPDGSTTGTTAGTSYTTTLSSTADNCWAVLYDAGDRQPVASTGSTQRSAGSNDGIFDSNSAKTPAGSISMTLTRASGGGQAEVMATFKPVATSAFIPTIMMS